MSKKQEAVKSIGKILFFIYMVVLIYFLFFSEKYGRTSVNHGYRYNLVPFTEIKRYIIYSNKFTVSQIVVNLIGNIVAFMPMGFFVPVVLSKFSNVIKVTLLGLLFSLIVEVIQLFTYVGSFDVDDIILNTIGTTFGYIVYFFCVKPIMRNSKKKKRKD